MAILHDKKTLPLMTVMSIVLAMAIGWNNADEIISEQVNTVYETVIPVDTITTYDETDEIMYDTLASYPVPAKGDMQDENFQGRNVAAASESDVQRPTNIFDFLLTLTDKITILIQTLSPLLLPLITWYMQKSANKAQPAVTPQQ